MSTGAPENRLLATLTSVSGADHFTPVTWEARHPLYEPGQSIEHVYFPLDAVVSIVADLGDGSVVEVATVGREGLVGASVLLHGVKSDDRVFVQVPGRGVQVPVAELLHGAERHAELGRVLYSFVRALVTQITRSAACNRAHPIDERTARWLLMTHDRVGRDDFVLTQEFLGQMLGVARPRVSKAAAGLQRAGFIRYSRGHITVIDRPGLEEVSCECYRIIADGHERVFA